MKEIPKDGLAWTRPLGGWLVGAPVTTGPESPRRAGDGAEPPEPVLERDEGQAKAASSSGAGRERRGVLRDPVRRAPRG